MSGYRGRFGSLDTAGGPPPTVQIAVCRSCDTELMSDAYLGGKPEAFGWWCDSAGDWQCPSCVTQDGWGALIVDGEPVSVAWMPQYGGPSVKFDAGLPGRWFSIRETVATGGGVEWWLSDGFDSLRLPQRSWVVVSDGRPEIRPAEWLNNALNATEGDE